MANNWDSISAYCKSLFGIWPTKPQVRFWWFGALRGKNADYAGRQKWARQNINDWDVVVKLAIRYAWRTMQKGPRRWSDEHVLRFIHHLLWKTEQNRTAKAVRKDNNEIFYAQSFWGWAVEYRNEFSPVLSERKQKERNDMKLALRNLTKAI